MFEDGLTGVKGLGPPGPLGQALEALLGVDVQSDGKHEAIYIRYTRIAIGESL
jgi:hypothetical protein